MGLGRETSAPPTCFRDVLWILLERTMHTLPSGSQERLKQIQKSLEVQRPQSRLNKSVGLPTRSKSVQLMISESRTPTPAMPPQPREEYVFLDGVAYPASDEDPAVSGKRPVQEEDELLYTGGSVHDAYSFRSTEERISARQKVDSMKSRSYRGDIYWANDLIKLIDSKGVSANVSDYVTLSESSLFSHISKLELRERGISQLDAYLVNFRHLEELNVSGNEIEVIQNIPDSVKILNAYGNRIRKCIFSAASLRNLQHLGLGGNRIDDVQLRELLDQYEFPSLISLDLSYNQLMFAQETFETLSCLHSSLRLLQIRGNPFVWTVIGSAILHGEDSFVIRSLSKHFLPELQYLDGNAISFDDINENLAIEKLVSFVPQKECIRVELTSFTNLHSVLEGQTKVLSTKVFVPAVEKLLQRAIAAGEVAADGPMPNSLRPGSNTSSGQSGKKGAAQKAAHKSAAKPPSSSSQRPTAVDHKRAALGDAPRRSSSVSFRDSPTVHSSHSLSLSPSNIHGDSASASAAAAEMVHRNLSDFISLSAAEPEFRVRVSVLNSEEVNLPGDNRSVSTQKSTDTDIPPETSAKENVYLSEWFKVDRDLDVSEVSMSTPTFSFPWTPALCTLLRLSGVYIEILCRFDRPRKREDILREYEEGLLSGKFSPVHLCQENHSAVYTEFAYEKVVRNVGQCAFWMQPFFAENIVPKTEGFDASPSRPGSAGKLDKASKKAAKPGKPTASGAAKKDGVPAASDADGAPKFYIQRSDRLRFSVPSSVPNSTPVPTYTERRSQSKNYFINFSSTPERRKVWQKIIQQRPKSLKYEYTLRPEQMVKKLELTKRWQMRQISNFEYLMELNTIAGRTYNDLHQYHVFPWIIADWKSETLDLSDPKTFRDLSKPIGALSDSLVDFFRDRYSSMEVMNADPSMSGEEGIQMPPFHYGSHYSNAGIVLHYLLRMEPFAQYHILLQSGKFDHADRLFRSLPATFASLPSTSDVKEMVPEFFYCPDFLVNRNRFDLGTTQTGFELGDVELPPWAKGCPVEFVRLHREALESEYVSQHLHSWIDLIFGYRQKGPEAVEALNVFYYLTYEGAVNLDEIKDPTLRRSTESMIENFGQTPSQLFRKPHPPRGSLPPSRMRLLLPSGTPHTSPMSVDAINVKGRERSFEINTRDSLVKSVEENAGNKTHMKTMSGNEGGVLDMSQISDAVTEYGIAAEQKLRTYGLWSARVQFSHRGIHLQCRTLTSSVLSSLVGVPVPVHTVYAPTAYVVDRLYVVLDNGMVLISGHSAMHFLQSPSVEPSSISSSGPSSSLSITSGESAFDTEGSLRIDGMMEFSVVGGNQSAAKVQRTLTLSTRLGSPSGPSSETFGSNQLFALTIAGKTGSDPMVFSGGHWDYSVKVHAAQTGQITQSLVRHKDIVTCLCLSPGADVLVTGSKDTTIIVWNLAKGVIDPLPRHVLAGHDDSLLSLSLSVDLDIIISGSKDGTVMAHTWRLGRMLWSLKHPQRKPVDRVALCEAVGLIAFCSKSDGIVYLHTINGQYLGSQTPFDFVKDAPSTSTSNDSVEVPNALVFTTRGNALIVGGERGTISVLEITSMQILRTYRVPTLIRSITLLNIPPPSSSSSSTISRALISGASRAFVDIPRYIVVGGEHTAVYVIDTLGD